MGGRVFSLPIQLADLVGEWCPLTGDPDYRDKSGAGSYTLMFERAEALGSTIG